MQAYSREMRRDVLAAGDAGMPTQEVALKFKVSKAWVRLVKRERREKGKIAPATTRNRTPRWREHEDSIRKCIDDQPDITLREIREKIGGVLSISTISNALHVLKITRKKRAFTPQNSSGKTCRKSGPNGP